MYQAQIIAWIAIPCGGSPHRDKSQLTSQHITNPLGTWRCEHRIKQDLTDAAVLVTSSRPRAYKLWLYGLGDQYKLSPSVRLLVSKRPATHQPPWLRCLVLIPSATNLTTPGRHPVVLPSPATNPQIWSFKLTPTIQYPPSPPWESKPKIPRGPQDNLEMTPEGLGC